MDIPAATHFYMPIGNQDTSIHDDLKYGIRSDHGSTQLFPGYNGVDKQGWFVSTDFNSDTTYTGECYEITEFECKTYHSGEDWNGTGGGNTDQGQPVFSIAVGRVLFSGWAIGNTVIIVHRVPDADSNSKNDELVASLYGHLQNVPGLRINDLVYPGTFLGEVGTALTDNGGAQLHWEIRRQSMLTENKLGDISLDEPADHWPGSNSQFIAENYYDPSDFIKEKDQVGKFVDGWHTDGVSQAILGRFLRAKRDGESIGWPDANNYEGYHVHDVKGITLQRFRDAGSAKESSAAIILSQHRSKEAYIIKDRFWAWYSAKEYDSSTGQFISRGLIKLGAPIGDAYAVGDSIRQDFEINGGYLLFYDPNPQDGVSGQLLAMNNNGAIDEDDVPKVVVLAYEPPRPMMGSVKRAQRKKDLIIVIAAIVMVFPFLVYRK